LREELAEKTGESKSDMEKRLEDLGKKFNNVKKDLEDAWDSLTE
jgi:hypothetical protein